MACSSSFGLTFASQLTMASRWNFSMSGGTDRSVSSIVFCEALPVEEDVGFVVPLPFCVGAVGGAFPEVGVHVLDDAAGGGGPDAALFGTRDDLVVDAPMVIPLVAHHLGAVPACPVIVDVWLRDEEMRAVLAAGDSRVAEVVGSDDGGFGH